MAAWEEWTAAAVAAAETYVIEPLAQTLHAAATPHLEKFPKFFFRSARQHAIETIAWNVLAVIVLLAIRPYHRAAVAKETGGLRPRTWFDVLLGLVMVGFVALQFYVKYSRGGWPDVWYLFMPCHVYTTMLALCLLLRDRRWVNRIFTIVVVYTAWSPILALVFPDFSDQIYPYEKPVYIIHHIVIIAAPYYMVTQRDRFQLLPKSYYWLGWVFLLILMQLNMQTFASYQSGININFQLVPPELPETFAFLLDEWYRVKIVPVLLLLCIATRPLVEAVGRAFGGASPSPSASTTSTKPKRH